MGDSKGQYQKLPPGWDCKVDQSTGTCYYINYFTKAMQLEDPRTRYKQLQNERCSTESIPLQPVHGSPYHVYPSNNLPAMRAFQAGPGTNTSIHNMSSSPLLSSRGHLEMSPLLYGRSSQMNTPRLANMSRRSTIQETSFSNQIDTDAVVLKIQNMFPTASEDHIRLLLKKYYNREAVVISALQVEKHPVTMPGPFVTPPAQRHLFHSNSAFHMTPPARRLDMGAAAVARAHGYGYFGGSGASTARTASPIPGGRYGSAMSMHSGVSGMAGGGGVGGNGVVAAAAFAMPYYHHYGSPRHGDQWQSPKPHSPKMKLRYMKNIFPKADEMLLLDILASADNNVQKASEQLLALGYTKREFVPPAKPPRQQPPDASKRQTDEKIITLRPTEYSPDEKEAIQARLKVQYPQIADRILLMALESVNYAEDRAMQILDIVQQEDEAQAHKHPSELATTLELDETIVGVGESTVDAAATDNIITVVLETTSHADNKTNNNDKIPPSRSSNSSTTSPKSQHASKKKLAFPSINLITPTTATTQIILSNSPICMENDAHELGNDNSQVTNNKNASSTQTDISNIIDNNNKLADSTTTTAVVASPSNATSAKLSSASSTSSSTSTVTNAYQPMSTKSILARSNSLTFGVKAYLHGSNYGGNHVNATTSSASSACILEKLKLSRPRDKSDTLKNIQRNSIEEDAELHQEQEFKSIIGRIATMGHNPELAKGANEGLLLADYVTWNGANPDISLGHRQSVTGPDAGKLSERSYNALGRNPELCKGAQSGLAKGSIYVRPKNNIKCN